MDLMALESTAELSNFAKIFSVNYNIFTLFINIGGILSKFQDYTTWTWITTGRRINYKLNMAPGKPDNADGIEYCLSLMKVSPDEVSFNDMFCSTMKMGFICEIKT